MSLGSFQNVGFGTFNAYTDHARVGETTRNAVKAGYKLFNLASSYGNQREVGAALRAAVAAGEATRANLCIVSKLGMSASAPEDVEAACRATLAETGLEYLDCYLMHWPDSTLELEGEPAALLATWKAMEALVDQGLVRSLGVSNFTKSQLQHLLTHAAVKPAVNEVELSPYLAQPTLVQFCEEKDIHLIASSPLGKVGDQGADAPGLLADPVVLALAAQSRQTPAQVALRWGVQRGWTVMVPAAAASAPRLAELLDVSGWRLSRTAMDALDGLNQEDVQLPKTQPEVIKGTFDAATGDYQNAFFRPGKHLRTDITIKTGVLSNLATRARDLLPPSCAEAPNFLVTDEICDRAFGAQVLDGLRAAGYTVTKVVIPADEIDEAGVSGTEAYKTTGVLSRCYDEILGKGISKHSCIISLGGGVVNNICGMIAGTLYRGISLVHFTTTTMGMADAAIDFKQAVNHSLGKNLIGCYYPASRVVIDTEVLTHLAPRHILNGVAEALKHGLAQSADLTELIVAPFRERGVAAAVADPEVLDRVIKACIEYKVPTLIYYHDSDLNEMAPQYGHCVGHAVEYTSYHDGKSSPLLHGEAVAIGMCVSADIAFLMGLCDEACVVATYGACETVGLPVHVPASMDLEDVKKKMMYDKHFVKKPTMGLPVRLGQLYEFAKPDGTGTSFMSEVDADVVDGALKRNAARRNALAALRAPPPAPIVLAAPVSSEEEDASSVEAEEYKAGEKSKSRSPKGSAFGLFPQLEEGRGSPFKPMRKAASTSNLASSGQPLVVNGVELEDVFFLKFVKTTSDVRAINDFRANYVKFRGGDAKGCDGEVTTLATRLNSEPTEKSLPTAGVVCVCCN